jgi:hypothetical protein
MARILFPIHHCQIKFLQLYTTTTSKASTIDQWATEAGKQEGDEINTADAAAYLKSGSWHESDVVGNPYIVGLVGTKQITVSASTKALLVGPSIDWGSY